MCLQKRKSVDPEGQGNARTKPDTITLDTDSDTDKENESSLMEDDDSNTPSRSQSDTAEAGGSELGTEDMPVKIRRLYDNSQSGCLCKDPLSCCCPKIV